MFIENGENIKAVQNRLVHVRISTTMNTYSHSTDKITDELIYVLEKNANIRVQGWQNVSKYYVFYNLLI